ncbi:OmpA family protein [Roseateles sp. BYS96W]|uniref:OmpA family protein n=1 Tax=Pelomonas nitida TaxID=3299027 RepID=A0ABW7G573_9BURK
MIDWEFTMCVRRALRGCVLTACVMAAVAAHAQETVEVGSGVPTVSAIKEGLFPEDACEQLVAAGFKCMGFKPAVRFSLPALAFKVGSADIPDGLRKQLDVFAEALASKRGSGKTVRIEGHADDAGATENSQELSQKRADEVKRYLVARGADDRMLNAVGRGATAPKVKDPLAAENRRVEISRQTPP